jgi:hypothetical protein
MRLYEGPTVVEAARRLDMRIKDVYLLVFDGTLEGGPGRDGHVHVTDEAIAAHLQREGVTR